ncbi:MAG: Na+/H+ antiporter subunit D [Actinomycetota bacterium]
MSALVPLLVAIPLIGAAITLVFGRNPRLQVVVSIGTLTTVAVIAAVLLIAVDAGTPLAVSVGGWPVPFGIILYVDRLAALLVLISSIVLLAVFLFSVGQGAADGTDETPVSIFNPSYLILAAGIFNAFIAGDLFNLYVGFEILLVASYVLITLGSTESRIRTGAVYIVVSLVSSILFLASIAMIYGALGTVNMVQIAERMAELPQDTQLVLHLMLVIAFGIKAAIFPVSFWLPDSYPTAPAPVTAVFAGLLTKVGVYALIRTETQLFSANSIDTVLLIIALATMIVGVLGAVAQAELKRILSFTLVSHVGYMIFGLAIATPAAIGATVYYIVHHIVVQTTLFLAVGLIERRAGSTSILRVKGLMKVAPVLAVLYFVPAINLGGLPPFSGFIGKFALFEAAAEVGTPIMMVLIGGGIVTSLLTLYALMRAWNLAFWREEEDSAETEGRISYLGNAPAADDQQERRRIPRIMTLATGGMVSVTIALTVFAGPLYALCDRIGGALLEPVSLVQLEEEVAP